MSTCFSREGEYSDHVFPPDPESVMDEFTCDRCGSFDEYAAIAEIERIRTAPRRLPLAGGMS